MSITITVLNKCFIDLRLTQGNLGESPLKEACVGTFARKRFEQLRVAQVYP